MCNPKHSIIMKKIVKIILLSLAALVGLFVMFCFVVLAMNYVKQSDRRKQWNAWLDGGAETLRQAPAYDTVTSADFPVVTYADPISDPGIARVRDYFKVDEIAGMGDEVTRIKSIMQWVRKNVKYDGSKSYDGECNSIALYEYGKRTGNGLNCRMVATIANELYLAAGFRSRFVTCMPRDSMDTECHVINAVWSGDKQKWLWMDSAFGAFVMDGSGELLSVPEVREGIIAGLPMILNEGEKTTSGIERTYYLDKYMAKNLYWIGIEAEYRFNTESTGLQVEGALLPPDFRIWSQQARWYEHVTYNAAQFWQAPE